MGTIEYMSYLRCSMAGDFEEEFLQHLLCGKDSELTCLLSQLDPARAKRWLRVALISLVASHGRDAMGSMFESSVSAVSRKLAGQGLSLSAERVQSLETALILTAKDLDPLFCEQVSEAWRNFVMCLKSRAFALLPAVRSEARHSTQVLQA